MFDTGLVAEVQGLVDLGLASALTANQAIGYKEVIDYLEGACTLDEAIDTIKRRSRNYAKRQISWFRHDGRVRWLDLDSMSDADAVRCILDDLKEPCNGSF